MRNIAYKTYKVAVWFAVLSRIPNVYLKKLIKLTKYTFVEELTRFRLAQV